MILKADSVPSIMVLMLDFTTALFETIQATLPVVHTKGNNTDQSAFDDHSSLLTQVHTDCQGYIVSLHVQSCPKSVNLYMREIPAPLASEQASYLQNFGRQELIRICGGGRQPHAS